MYYPQTPFFKVSVCTSEAKHFLELEKVVCIYGTSPKTLKLTVVIKASAFVLIYRYAGTSIGITKALTILSDLKEPNTGIWDG